MRNAAALSLVTGDAFRISNIRGKRPKPGLMRQHVTAIEAACVISGAETTGLAVGSTELSFKPGKVTPGDYHFAVGTAGVSAGADVAAAASPAPAARWRKVRRCMGRKAKGGRRKAKGGRRESGKAGKKKLGNGRAAVQKRPLMPAVTVVPPKSLNCMRSGMPR